MSRLQQQILMMGFLVFAFQAPSFAFAYDDGCYSGTHYDENSNMCVPDACSGSRVHVRGNGCLDQYPCSSGYGYWIERNFQGTTRWCVSDNDRYQVDAEAAVNSRTNRNDRDRSGDDRGSSGSDNSGRRRWGH